MEALYFKKAIEIVNKKKCVTISELCSELMKLGLKKKEVLPIINKVIESPLTMYTSDTIQIL